MVVKAWLTDEKEVATWLKKRQAVRGPADLSGLRVEWAGRACNLPLAPVRYDISGRSKTMPRLPFVPLSTSLCVLTRHGLNQGKDEMVTGVRRSILPVVTIGRNVNTSFGSWAKNAAEWDAYGATLTQTI